MGSFEFMQCFSYHFGTYIHIPFTVLKFGELIVKQQWGEVHSFEETEMCFSSYLRPFSKVASFLTCFVLSFPLSL